MDHSNLLKFDSADWLFCKRLWNNDLGGGSPYWTIFATGSSARREISGQIRSGDLRSKPSDPKANDDEGAQDCDGGTGHVCSSWSLAFDYPEPA